MHRRLMILPIGLVGAVVIAFVGGTLVRLLWNALLPPLFGWPVVTFWQALGLLALCRILFGGVGLGGRSHGPRFRRRMGERWEHMTPDERERFGQGIHTI
jgi:hypothetical protein